MVESGKRFAFFVCLLKVSIVSQSKFILRKFGRKAQAFRLRDIGFPLSACVRKINLTFTYKCGIKNIALGTLPSMLQGMSVPNLSWRKVKDAIRDIP